MRVTIHQIVMNQCQISTCALKSVGVAITHRLRQSPRDQTLTQILPVILGQNQFAPLRFGANSAQRDKSRAMNPERVSIFIFSSNGCCGASTISCLGCGGYRLKSAFEESLAGRCSTRPIDWLCGHPSEEELHQSLVDVLVCENPNCQRFNYMRFRSHRSDHGVDLVDSGLSLSDLVVRRWSIIDEMDSAVQGQFPSVLLDLVADYTAIPKSQAFISPLFPETTKRHYNGPRFDIKVTQPVYGQIHSTSGFYNRQGIYEPVCKVDDEGHIVLVPNSNYRIVDILTVVVHRVEQRIALVYGPRPRVAEGFITGAVEPNLKFLPALARIV